MSSTLPDPESAAPSGSLRRPEQGQGEGEDGDANVKHPLWTAPPRAKAASLSTQALATNYEADENVADPDALFKFPETLTDRTQHFFPLPNEQLKDERHNGLNTEGSAQSRTDNMAMVALPSAGDLRSFIRDSSTPTSSSTFSLHNMSNVNSLLPNHRELLNNTRGRGTSLERTDKEKRQLPRGPISTNPGDTGMSGPTTPQSPSTPESISNNPPTDGMRARYRSWRDARPPAAERAWSIDQHGSDDSGQVENSIKEALAGVEPNSRSRKASHTLRFFKEGLPEDRSKLRDTRKRGQTSKEAAARVKGATVLDNGKFKQAHENIANGYNSPDARSPVASPLERDRPASKHGRDPKLNASEFAEGSETGYFHVSHDSDVVSEDQMKRFPAQLLVDIRKNHNLTPGASKGTSFSRSLPVTASEKPVTDFSPEFSSSSKANREQDKSDDSEVNQVKTDEEDDSGEEQISSAFFVPHQTPHESPERKRDEPETATRPPLQCQDNPDVSNSQQWLEEHEVPSRDVDEKYLSNDTKSRPLPSPTPFKPPTPCDEKDSPSSVLPDPAGVERDSQDEGYSTKGDESGLTDDQESDTTPTGSLKRDSHIPSERSSDRPKLHDHQQEQQQPLDAIELIPYRHQVGGHTTMWRFSKRAVCKQLNNRENEFYEKVERYHPKLLKFLPRYIGVLNVKFEKQRRKPTKKDDLDEKEPRDGGMGITDSQPKPESENTSINDHASTTEENRVISQSLQSSSVPIPTVTFADNRHIIPKSFLRPSWHLGDLQHRSKSAGNTTTRLAANQAQPPLPDGEFTFRKYGPTLDTGGAKGKTRPTLEDKHSDSWGSTIKNKDLRNKVFDEAFLQQPIPIHHHRKPASQRRSLPNRHGSILRASNSETSLKAAQQSQTVSTAQPAEESMRRRALKTAAEQRKSSLVPLTAPQPAKEDGSIVSEGEIHFDDKTGTSAPEPEVAHGEDTPKGKRQRRYSSGGLRRKPTEVADDRGNLKYFEEADDAGYKGDAEEEVFAMDFEPSQDAQLNPNNAGLGLDVAKGSNAANFDPLEGIAAGTMLPMAPEDPNLNLDMPRPINPKEAQTQQGCRVEYFLLLEDLTAGMKRPCIMDLKMGTRQYGVEANEKKQNSQRQKCAATTSKELGVRVCGLQVWDIKTQKYIFQDKYFGRDLKAGRQFQNALLRFLYDGVDDSSVLRHIPTILQKLAELEVLIRTLVGYRFYAASLLMFYDGDTAEEGESDSTATEKDMGSERKEIDFKIADFANCVVREEFRTHPPCPPRHPELPDKGFLRGLRSLKKYFLAIQEELQRKELGYSKEEIRKEDADISFDGANEYDGDEAGLSY